MNISIKEVKAKAGEFTNDLSDIFQMTQVAMKYPHAKRFMEEALDTMKCQAANIEVLGNLLYETATDRDHWKARTKALEWVSVNDRLPVEGERVLMCVDGTSVFEGWIGPNGWCRYTNESISDWLGAVTHWMPLPEPPKKVGNEAKP